MEYLVELRTAAGPITCGPFATLDEARTWAAGSGVIVALIPPSVPARDLIQGTRANVLAMLDAAQGTEPAKNRRQDRPGSTNSTPPAI